MVGPRVVAFDHPPSGAALASMTALSVFTFVGDVDDVASSARGQPDGLRVGSLVRAQVLSVARGRAWSADRDALECVANQRLVMHIRAGDRDPQWDAAAVSQCRTFHAEFATIGRVFPGLFPPRAGLSSSPRPCSAIPSRCRSGRHTLPVRASTTAERHRAEPTTGSTHGSRCRSRTRAASLSTGSRFSGHTKFPRRLAASATADAHLDNWVCKKGAAVRSGAREYRESGETVTKLSPP